MADEAAGVEEGGIEIEDGKIGFLHIKCGKKKYKYTWVALQGSSFFTYKDAKVRRRTLVLSISSSLNRRYQLARAL